MMHLMDRKFNEIGAKLKDNESLLFKGVIAIFFIEFMHIKSFTASLLYLSEYRLIA